MIIGDGPDKEYIKKLMSEYESKHTIFFGKKVDDATKYILLSDLVILPSSGGLSVINSLVCGKPFIGSRDIEHGGILDYVDHNINGFLFDEDNIQQFFAGVRKILSSKNIYSIMSNEAKKKSFEFTIEKMVNGFENAIRFVTNENFKN